VWVNVFANAHPDTFPFHHGPETAGLSQLAVFRLRGKVVGVYSPGKIPIHCYHLKRIKKIRRLRSPDHTFNFYPPLMTAKKGKLYRSSGFMPGNLAVMILL
jgi:hypothetical protein